MPPTTQLSLSDLELEFPDWDALLIYSDFFEDAGDLQLAHALCWLSTHAHWPYPVKAGPVDSPWNWRWWVAPDPSTYYSSYYSTLSGGLKAPVSNHILPYCLATLPPAFTPALFPRNKLVDTINSTGVDIISFSDAILTFSQALACLSPADQIAHTLPDKTFHKPVYLQAKRKAPSTP